MPDAVAEDPSLNEGVRLLYRHTSGGRVRFSTDSPYIAFRCEYENAGEMPHMPAKGVRGFDLFWDREDQGRFIRCFVPPMDSPRGYESSARTVYGSGMQSYTLHFPLYNRVSRVRIGLHPKARVGSGKPYREEKPLVFYGNSVTQGGCASRPGNSYSNLVSNELNLDHVNLGFSGSGKGEEAMFRYLASLDPLMLILDYDQNSPNAEHLERTHRRGFELFREAHPNTPVLFLTMPNWGNNNPESSYGRAALRRDVVYRTYSEALRNGDKNVYFIDGRSFFARRDRFACTVDGSHPNDLGMYFMAEGLCDAVRCFL